MFILCAVPSNNFHWRRRQWFLLLFLVKGLTVQHNSSMGNESYRAEDVKIFRWPLIDGKNNDTLRASEVLGAKKYS
jgi:hypothetical protein